MRVCCALLLAAILCAPAPSWAGDWVHWRGPEQNGVSRERDLPEKWSEDPDDKDNNLIWKADFGARCAPIILNDRLYLINDVGEGLNEQERVLCCDANTGKLLKEYRMNVFLTDVVSSRVGWCNLAGDPETGNIYLNGSQGLFICFDKDLKVLWQRSTTEEFGRVSGYGGRIPSPIVDGDLVIVGIVNSGYGDQSKGSNRFVAFDKKTGQIVWWSDTVNQIRQTYYSSPVVAVIGGQRLLISGGGDGAVHAFKVRTGEKVWSYLFGQKNINSSPVVAGDLVYIGQGEENPDGGEQGRIICLNGAKVKDGLPELVWQKDGMKMTYASPIIHEGRLYVTEENGTIDCLDAATGEKLWKYKMGGSTKGSPVLADGKLYVPQVEARFFILKPGDKKCTLLDEHRFSNANGQGLIEVNGSPAIVNGRIYLPTADNLYCIGKKGHNAPAAKIPPAPQEAPVNPADPPAKLLLFPGDVTLLPGESASFKVRAYNDKGQFLKEVTGAWSMPVPPTPPGTKVPSPPLKGAMTGDTLTVDKNVSNQQGPLVCTTADKLEARGRIRVIPPLPISEDFSGVAPTRTPAGWVGVQGKFVVVQKNGVNVLQKTIDSSIPIRARCYTYMGRPSDSGYTVETEVMGDYDGLGKGENLSDMGIEVNRYTLVLAGGTRDGSTKQRLRLLSWEAMPRVEKNIDFDWKANVWYCMKMTTEPVGDSLVIKGKVWEKGKPEPAAWTVQFTDPMPNRTGSPGLYAYAKGLIDNELSPTWFANVRVTKP